MQQAAARVDELDPDALWGPLQAPVTALADQVHGVAATTSTAAKAVQLLPAMLGADGPREYLLLVISNAEPRAIGGIPGMVVRLRADAGAVQLVEQRSAGGSLSGLPEPVLPLTRDEMALFGEGLGIYMADVTFTPDFPRSAELAKAIWEQQVGGAVDGVVAVDVGAMSYVMEATGPLTLADGSVLSAENVVQQLLNTVYVELPDNAAHDAYFALASASIMSAVFSGAWDPATMIDAMARAGRESRLLVWSAHPEEQAQLAGTVLGGELAGSVGDSPLVTVAYNDGSASKIGYYLRSEVVGEVTECFTDGSRAVRVRVVMTSTAPADAAGLPAYVAGGVPTPPGEMRMNVLLYAPEGGYVDEVEISVPPPGVTSQTHDGLLVVGRTVQLKPGESATLTYDIRTGIGHSGPLALRTTPLALGESSVVEGVQCS